jgi:polyhydroxyalkanoate synthesis repressor PhaR
MPRCGKQAVITGVRPMIRVIKRYGSRKLYDTEESRYILLEEIGGWVRAGQEVRIVDTTTDEDVTAQVLMLVILEAGRRGRSLFTSDILHDVIRHGEQVVHDGVEQIQEGMGRLLDASLDRIGPLRRVRDEAEQLRDRLARLEQTIAEIEARPGTPTPPPAHATASKGRAVASAKKGKATHV